jgi:hypothetical protein
VLAALDRPAMWQTELFGPVPRGPAGRAVWCDAAHRLEAHLDRHGQGGPGRTDLHHDLAQTYELCAVADDYLELTAPASHPHQWAYAAERAREVRDELFIDQPYRAQEAHVERGVGLEIGW